MSKSIYSNGSIYEGELSNTAEMKEPIILPVITLYQPWATWIMRDWKLIETRTHPRFASLLGRDLLIHSGGTTDKSDAAINNPYLTSEQLRYKPEEIINGFILG